MPTTLFLGTRKGLFAVERNGGGWRIARTAHLGTQVPMLLPDPRNGTLLAALEHGHFGMKLHASSDDGRTWRELASPTYPPKPDNVPDVMCPMRKIPIPWSVIKIWALEAGGASEPGVVWCGTIPGGLFKSTDAGASWSLVESLWNQPGRAKWFGGGYDYPGIHTVLVDPRDCRRVLVAVSCGGVWETRDSGQSWQLLGEGLVADYVPPEAINDPGIQDVHRAARSAGSPDRMWVQHHNGIFRSDDAGKTWQRCTGAVPSDFGFSVAVHPNNGDIAWFVPGIKDDFRLPTDGALCVMRTRDGGRTFEACRNGLPQDHAYHLVYRHALDVAEDGRTLAFGSTTGSVWLSENGGDDWTRLSADLPPVYCVRWQ